MIDARRDEDLARLPAIAPGGIDAVLALAGGAALDRCLEHVRKGGRAAYPHGVEPEPRERPGLRVIAYDGEPGPRQFARLARAAAEARLRVPVAGVYPLEQAAKAHERLAGGRILGRMVIQVR